RAGRGDESDDIIEWINRRGDRVNRLLDARGAQCRDDFARFRRRARTGPGFRARSGTCLVSKELNMDPTVEKRIKWDIGTAYDFFISLWVLHEPEHLGLRGSWAAGVRSRLPAPERELLQRV